MNTFIIQMSIHSVSICFTSLRMKQTSSNILKLLWALHTIHNPRLVIMHTQSALTPLSSLSYMYTVLLAESSVMSLCSNQKRTHTNMFLCSVFPPVQNCRNQYTVNFINMTFIHLMPYQI